MVVATTAGLVALAVGTPWWLRRRAPQSARVAVVTMVVGLVVTLTLQLLTNRPRPVITDALLPSPPLPSFPSGHVVLVMIAVVVASATHRRMALALLPAALLVAISRVHVGHHHPTDALGGVFVGVGLGLGARAWLLAERDGPWRWRCVLWPQIGLVMAVSLVAYTGVFSDGHAWWLQVPGTDKVLHLLAFGFVALGVHLQTRGRAVWGERLPLAVVLPLGVAALEELVQATSPHRSADLGDLLADLVGLLLFWRLGVWFTSTPRRPSKNGATPSEKLPRVQGLHDAQ
ncbi:MAG: VanZ family protein [Deltaproteobacteria bacterium]|nr:VanZ family protein [Deltaproteobacteria bacterium]